MQMQDNRRTLVHRLLLDVAPLTTQERDLQRLAQLVRVRVQLVQRVRHHMAAADADVERPQLRKALGRHQDGAALHQRHRALQAVLHLHGAPAASAGCAARQGRLDHGGTVGCVSSDL